MHFLTGGAPERWHQTGAEQSQSSRRTGGNDQLPSPNALLLGKREAKGEKPVYKQTIEKEYICQNNVYTYYNAETLIRLCSSQFPYLGIFCPFL